MISPSADTARKMAHYWAETIGMFWYLFRLPSERKHARLYAHRLQLRSVKIVAGPSQLLEIHVAWYTECATNRSPKPPSVVETNLFVRVGSVLYAGASEHAKVSITWWSIFLGKLEKSSKLILQAVRVIL